MNILARFVVTLALVLLAVPAGAQKTTEPQPMARPGESTEPPRPTAAPVPVVVQHDLPRAGGVLVFGGVDGAGLALVKALAATHTHVTIVTDETSENPTLADPTLTAQGVTTAKADVNNPETLKTVFTSAPFRAVVLLPGEKGSARPEDTAAAKNIVDATKAAGVPRFILLSKIGAGESAGALPWYVSLPIQMFAAKVLPALTQMESDLKAAPLDYTIIRAGKLSDGPGAGTAALVPDPLVYSKVTNADLAGLIAMCVDDETAIGKTLSVFDSTRTGFLAMFKS